MIEQFPEYSELILTFSDLNLSIVSDYFLSWKCVLEVEKNKSNNDDKEEGWDAIPTYGQALLICVIILVSVAMLLGGYKYYLIQQKKQKLTDPLLPPSYSAKEGSLSFGPINSK